MIKSICCQLQRTVHSNFVPADYYSSSTQHTPYDNSHDPTNPVCTKPKMKTLSRVPLGSNHLVVIGVGVPLIDAIVHLLRSVHIPSALHGSPQRAVWHTHHGFPGRESQLCAVPAAIWSWSLALASLRSGLNIIRGVWTFMNPGSAQDTGLWLLNTFSMSVTAFTQRP